MKTRNSKVRRISNELWNEIEKMSKNNNMGYTEASREIARMINRKRKRKIIYEIKF